MLNCVLSHLATFSSDFIQCVKFLFVFFFHEMKLLYQCFIFCWWVQWNCCTCNCSLEKVGPTLGVIFVLQLTFTIGLQNFFFPFWVGGGRDIKSTKCNFFSHEKVMKFDPLDRTLNYYFENYQCSSGKAYCFVSLSSR